MWVKEGVLFEALTYIIYIKERFSITICTFQKAINSFEVDVDVQKGPYGLEKKLTIIVLV